MVQGFTQIPFEFFQDDFKTLKYAIVGDDSAPEFFEINAENGQIKTRGSLDRENNELYRVSN